MPEPSIQLDHDANPDDEPGGYVFAVAEKAYCCWDQDLDSRNIVFLDGLDTAYYGRVADTWARLLDPGAPQHLSASIALRGTYLQAIETLFSMLGAYAQAPGAVPAWLASCGTQDLRTVVAHMRARGRLLTQCGRQTSGFPELSESVHRFCWREEEDDATAARFGRFWMRLSRDLTDPNPIAEYNSIKHGLRISPGGFSIGIGLESTAGVPAAAEDMRSLGGSIFGSTFLRSDKLGDSSHHIRMRRVSLNWSAEDMVRRLHLISISIANIVSSLLCDLTGGSRTAILSRPQDPEAFEQAFAGGVGVRSSNFDNVVPLQAATENAWTRARLLATLERRGTSGGATDWNEAQQ